MLSEYASRALYWTTATLGYVTEEPTQNSYSWYNTAVTTFTRLFYL